MYACVKQANRENIYGLLVSSQNSSIEQNNWVRINIRRDIYSFSSSS